MKVSVGGGGVGRDGAGGEYQRAAGFITLAARSLPFNGLLRGGRAATSLKWPIKVLAGYCRS